MKHQFGFTSLSALIMASILLSIGGTGALAAFEQKNPEQLKQEFHTILASAISKLPRFQNASAVHVDEHSQTTVRASDATDEQTLTPTPSPESGVSPTPSGSPATVRSEGDLHEDNEAEIHERESNEEDEIHLKANGSLQIGTH